MILSRTLDRWEHARFKVLGERLTSNEVLVLNETRVFPARLRGMKKTGGKVELLLLEALTTKRWTALITPGLAVKEEVQLPGGMSAKIEKTSNTGEVELEFTKEMDMQSTYLQKYGQTPIPPYIKSQLSESKLRLAYQTIYANFIGSAAAPTAGMHFTQELLNKLRANGVTVVKLTLHVGLGTFQKLRQIEVAQNRLATEKYYIGDKTVKLINQAKAAGKKIVAVGTTTTRALESGVDDSGRLTAGWKQTDKFIFPPYKFRIIDSLITNFHLPKSSLLMLVAALTTYPQTKRSFETLERSLIGKAYQEAIVNGYRFYSFGDAMWID